MNRCIWIALIAALLVAKLPVRADDAKKLDGTWVPTEGTFSGQKLSDDFTRNTRLIIDGDRYTVHTGGQKDEGTLKPDFTKKPATFDIRPSAGPNKDKTMLAIFELTGDTLKVCYNLTGKERPGDFTSTAENKLLVIVYKRQK